MKNHKTYLLSLCLLLSSCVAMPSYFGDKLTPTTAVDVYYSAHDVQKNYKVIGHLNMPNGNQDVVKEKLTAYAKKIGADAIIITGNTVNNSLKYTSDIVNADALKYTR